MRTVRWLKLVLTLAALGLVTATGSAQAADVPASTIGYCSPAPQPAVADALPSQSAVGGLCSEAGPGYVPTAGSWRVAGPADGGGTLSLVAFVPQRPTWGDAGASRPSAGAPVSVATAWLAAIANRERLPANPAPFGAPELVWGDAGASRR
jgi:hypothetical protein